MSSHPTPRDALIAALEGGASNAHRTCSNPRLRPGPRTDLEGKRLRRHAHNRTARDLSASLADGNDQFVTGHI